MRKWAVSILILSILAMYLTGCTLTKVKAEGNIKPEYTVMKEDDIPEEIVKLIQENQEQEFQMTYQDGQFLYLLKGYGKQATGGYSIQIADLSLWDNAVHLQTILLGPDTKEDAKGEASYPHMVIKMEYREEPVIFE